ncbi:MAG: YicC family protein [Clostridia bacterium]|nr:YicC family protein [Clostridia bacterium]
MAYSMTAYGRATGSAEGKDYIVELKSVNSRFFDCSIKISALYGYFEEKIKAYLQSRGITRGKLSVFVGIDITENESTDILLDTSYTEKYLAALCELRDKFGLKDDISVMRVASNREIFRFVKQEEDAQKEWELFLPVLEKATDSFLEMRRAEGENLTSDLCNKMEEVRSYINYLKEHADDAQETYRKRLEAKLTSTLEGLNVEVDQARIVTECAIFADKTAIDEELTRLESHYKAFYDTLKSEDSIGRKLDFLFQEVNREINTVGSKVSDINLTRIVVEVKTLLEKIREQIQNLE